MPGATSNPEQRDDNIARSSEELDDLYNQPSAQRKEPISADELERQVYSTPGNQPSDPGRRPSKKNDEEENDSEDLSDDSEDLESSSEEATPTSESAQRSASAASLEETARLEEHDDILGAGYKSSKKKHEGKSLRDRLGRASKRRKLIAILTGGSTIAGIAVIIFMFFAGGLNMWKLDNIMSNIAARTFARLHGVEERRGQRWMVAYMQARFLDVGNNPDMDPGREQNILFRANRVSNGLKISDVFLDWYRTMRLSDFEHHLFQDEGIKFTSIIGPDGQLRPGGGYVDIKGADRQKLNITPELLKSIEAGDIVAIEKYQEDILKFFDSDKEARRKINKVVADRTHYWQVFKKRQLRKAIRNVTGVRQWIFFEKTRNAYEDKKIEIRNKIITKAIPESTLSGKFVRCLFGITNCRFSSDTADSQYRADQDLAGSNNPDRQGDQLSYEDTEGNSQRTTIDLGPASEMIKQVLSKANLALNAITIISTMDMLSKLDKAIEEGKISEGVMIARAVQTTGLFQAMTTASDQMKTGELSAEELNDLMKVLGPVSKSEGWSKVIAKNGDPSKPTDTTESKKYCSTENQAAIENSPEKSNKQYAYLCPDKQIGGASNAGKLERTYNDTIGNVMGPMLDSYSQVRNAPVFKQLGDVLKAIGDAAADIIMGAMRRFLAVLGLQDNVEDAMKWMLSKMVAFLGAGPILNGNEGAGVMFNWMVQGGAFTAESTSRTLGASLTTNESRREAQITLAHYETEQEAQMSIFDKHFSLNNPSSTLSNQAFAVSQMSVSSLTSRIFNFGSIFKFFGSILSSPFNGDSQAATTKGYEGSAFADIPTYDFPPACFSLNPITASPSDGTNVLRKFSQYGITLSEENTAKLRTWDTLNNSDEFYDIIYQELTDAGKGDEADNIAQEIYNCNLLDTAIRGDRGHVYDYRKDHGLEDTEVETALEEESSGVSGNAQELARQILNNKNIDLNASNFCRYCQEDIQNTADGRPSYGTVRLNIKLLRFLAELGQVTKVDVNSITGAGSGHTSGSNHYQGNAIDFGCSLNITKADTIGRKHGITRYTGESCPGDGHWHYSTTGD